MSIQNTEQKQTPWAIIAVIIAAIIAFVIYYYVIAGDEAKTVPAATGDGKKTKPAQFEAPSTSSKQTRNNNDEGKKNIFQFQ